MENKERKKIVNLIAFAAKILTAFFQNPIEQVILQEFIDTVKDKALEIPEGFPLVKDVLKEYNTEIQFAVEDFFSEIEVNNIAAFVVDNKSEDMASKHIFYSQLTKMYFSDEVYTIEKALGHYIREIKEWVLRKPHVLVECLNHLGSENKELNRRIEQVERQVKNIIAQPATPVVNLKTYDSFLQDQLTFYNHTGMTPSLSINDFFLCDNYRKVILNDDCYVLNDCWCNQENLDQIGDALQILQEQKLLLITGMYGTGKTTLMKRMHLELRAGPDTCVFFFRARDMKSIMEGAEKNNNIFNPTAAIEQKLHCAFMGLFDGARPIYVFIDELEELNVEVEDTSYLSLFISWMCKFQKKNKWISFVLGSRKYAQVGDDKPVYIAENLFESYYDEKLGKELTIIRTDVFSPEARAEWIEEYSNRIGKYASYTSIKSEYKKIEDALKIPIFLLVFMQRYFNQSGSKAVTGYYHFYSNFIDKTIKGKYGTQSITSSFIKLPSNAQYRDVLSKIAFIIIQNSEKYIDSKIYIDTLSEEQPLLADDLTNKKFEMSLSKLRELLSTTEYITANFINCYFFGLDESRVYFTDTNILFALASEYIFKSIKKVVQAGDQVFVEEHIKSIEMVRLYPHLIDYIIYLAKNPTVSSHVISYLHSFVTNGLVKSHCIEVSPNASHTIEKILLLYILFIKTNQEPYNREEYRHIFKEIFYYTSMYKTQEYQSGHSGYAFSIERYFMQLELHQLRLNRINLKHYNFKGSKITGNCKFHQCKFYETNLKNVVMEGVNFSLCDFEFVKEFMLQRVGGYREEIQAKFDCCRVRQTRLIAQAVIFQNCIIDSLQLTLSGQKSVKFKNCYIKNLKIKIENNPKSAKLEFWKCCFENLPDISGFDKSNVLDMIKDGKSIT